MKNKENRYNTITLPDLNNLTEYLTMLLKLRADKPIQILLDIDQNNIITVNWLTPDGRRFEFVDADQQIMTIINYPDGTKEYCSEDEFDDHILSYVKAHPEYTIDSTGAWVQKFTVPDITEVKFPDSQLCGIGVQTAPLDIKAEGTMEAQPADKVYARLLEEGVEYVNTPDGPKKLSDLIKEKTTD